ncbi:hypothetical protein GF361_00720 [Candidatus Woesearchaeota archaeon]|nr:hypothetical protein [Candidatus Woesearchaeota archaeon]
MAEKEINITYETLYEILRREKTRDELQKINEGFFSDVAKYLKEKGEFLEQSRKKQDLFSDEEKKKVDKQIENIRKILKDLYEKREKKIIDAAIDVSRTPSINIDTSVMLKEERLLYDNILNVLNGFRNGVLLNIQQAKIPEIKENIELKKEEEREKPDEKKEEEQNNKEDNTRSVKITHSIPRFVGPDLIEYGPFEEGEDAEVPLEVADVLINKGRAE